MDSTQLTAISLFSGAAGLDLGVQLAVGECRTVAYVEREAYACEVLASRMEKDDLDPAPIWTDVSTFDGEPFRGLVDIILGGFPCQDISVAGKRAGIGGERSGLWKQFARIVEEVQPRLVFIENVAALRSSGLEVVLEDLASLGYDAEWGTLRASDVGATHHRDRLFLVAFPHGEGWLWDRRSGPEGEAAAGTLDWPEGPSDDVAYSDNGRLVRKRLGRVLDGERATLGHYVDGCGSEAVADDDDGTRCEGHGGSNGVRPEVSGPSGDRLVWPPGPDDLARWSEVVAERPDLEPLVRRVADGLAHRVDRLRLTGNGVVPAQAAAAYRQLLKRSGQ